MLKRFLFVIVIMSVVGLGFAGGIALSGVGTRAKGMGGAMRGLADDASAMYWNPAGISFLEESTLSVGIHYVDFNGEWEDETGTMNENADVLNLIPSAVYTKICPDKPWNFGFGVYIPFGLSAEWDLYDMPGTIPEAIIGIDLNGNGNLDDDIPLTWEGEIQENEKAGSLMVIDFHPTFSYQISEKLGVGIGLSIDYANMAINKLDLHPLYQDYLPTYTQLEGSGMGYGLNYGILFKPTPCLSLGFSGRLETELALEGDAQIDTYINNVIGAGLGLPATVINNNPDVEATLVLPADYGFGFGYKIKDNWLVSGDFTYTGWESVDVIELDFEEGFDIMGSPIEDTEMVLNWENTIRFGLGTEYVMGSLANRAGYYYDESPLVDETMTVTFPDFSDKNVINIGLGYMLNENICLDFGFEYIMMEEREVTEQTEENWLGVYNGNLIDIMLDFTWKF